MSKIWVLDTETKGTGAQMVPLENVLQKPTPSTEPLFVPAKPRPRSPKPSERPAPRRFKVVDVVTQETLADGVDVRATLDLLKDVRSIVDVSVFVWAPKAARWRLLTLGEQQTLWKRSRRPAADSAA